MGQVGVSKYGKALATTDSKTSDKKLFEVYTEDSITYSLAVDTYLFRLNITEEQTADDDEKHD